MDETEHVYFPLLVNPGENLFFKFSQEYVTVQDAPEAKALLTKQADWARVTNQLQEAAQMYIAAGDFLTAIEIIAQNDWTEM